MKYLKKLILLSAALVLATGCIKDDLEECDNVTIYFQYYADGETDVLTRYMDRVDLYVFDEGGHIKDVRTYTQDELSNASFIPSFKLQAGSRYKLVAVGNAHEQTEVVNLAETSFDRIFIQSPEWGSADRVTNHDGNYLGQLTFTMPDKEGMMYRDTVILRSAHVDVEVEINGLPAPSSRQDGGMPYLLSIENSNAQCSFNNEINESEKGTIYPDLVYDPQRHQYHTQNLALFRMDAGGVLDDGICRHTLVLTEASTGRELVRGSIYDYIVRNADWIDVTKQEALLPIAINFDGIQAEIKIPDWFIVDGKPEWN